MDSGVTSTSASPHTTGSRLQTYQRAYKACIQCRKKKTKCIILAEEYTAGLPCARCRRELRDCTFADERFNPGRTCGKTALRSRLNATKHQPSNKPPSPGAPAFSEPPVLSEEGSNDVLSNSEDKFDDLGDSALQLSVSRGSDAIYLLFAAARAQINNSNKARHETTESLSSSSPSQRTGDSIILSKLPPDALDTWRTYRFVRMGWFSAEEASSWVDSFFRNMAPQCHILDGFYENHENHQYLVLNEPFLCCVILMLSLRYHTLPGVGGQPRCHLIHQRLWEQCQNIILQIIMGQESSGIKTRSLGSVEALLLLLQWHPMAHSMPPTSDGWDTHPSPMTNDPTCQEANTNRLSPKESWLANVIDRAKQSDRMSCMVLSCAMTLANELGIIDGKSEPRSESDTKYGVYLKRRRRAAVKLLYVWGEQLSLRTGMHSMIPQGVNQSIIMAIDQSNTKDEQDWDTFMTARAELATTARSISNILYPANAPTLKLLPENHYANMIEHFCTVLETWNAKYLKGSSIPTRFHDIMTAEFQSARIFLNSLGLQAALEHCPTGLRPDEQHLNLGMMGKQHTHAEAMVDGCVVTLELAMKLAKKHALKYAPADLFIRVTIAAALLVKGLGLINRAIFNESLDILEQVTSALKQGQPDELHIAAQYSRLLEDCVNTIRAKMARSGRPSGLPTRHASPDQPQTSCTGTGLNNGRTEAPALCDPDSGLTGNIGAEGNPGEDWPESPLSPSLFQFVQSVAEAYPCFGHAGGDFLGNTYF